MTATPAAAATHMHPGGIEHYHDIACDRELRLHLFYGHDDGTPATMTAAERHRRAHAGDEAIARGAQLAADFNAAGRKIPEGPASAAPVLSGPLDPAARMAKAFVEAVRRLDNPEISPAAVETVLAEDLRAALRSYR